MVLFWQCLAGCVLFTAVLLPMARDPKKYSAMYPPGVQAAVGGAQGDIKQGRWASILVQGLAFVAVGVPLCLLAGKAGFGAAFWHMLVFFMVINLYDLLVVDWLLFTRLRVFRIEGTQERDELYKDYRYHFKVFLRGLALGLVVALVTGMIVWMVAK